MALRFLNSGYFAGKVGIGTETPTAPLDVFGVRAGRDWAINNRAVIRLDSNGAGYPSDILFGHTAAANETSWTGAYWSLSSRGSSADNKFYFYRGAGNPDGSGEGIIMTFDPNLNVGIGTTSPQSKLHIADSTLSLLKVQETSGNTGASAGALFKTSPNTGNSYFKGGILYEDTGNANVIGKLHLVNRVSADTTNAGVGDAKLTIDTAGNVGIGTTSPGSKLTVNGSFSADTGSFSNELTLSSNLRLQNNITILNKAQSAYISFATRNTTGSEVVMDLTNVGSINGGAAGPYLPLAGGTMTGALNLNDNVELRFGDDLDLRMEHDGGGGYIQNYTGNFTIRNYADDTSIIFQNDDGAGGIETYFQLEGASGGASPFTVFPDNSNLAFGSGHDLRLYHNGSVSYITNYTGTLDISNNADNADINFRNDDGAGGVSTYFYLDGSLTNGTTILGATRFPDNSKIYMGTGGDLEIYHDGSNSYIKDNGTGTLNLQGSTQVLIGGTNGEVGVQYVENAGVGLRHNNVTKLTTESTGINVVGDIKIDSALLSNQENTDVDTGTETVANVAIATYTAAFFDFVIKKTTNVRSGTVYACHDGTNVEFTETSTQDLGDTSDVTLSVDISGGNMRLQATTTSDDWSVKSLIRAI